MAAPTAALVIIGNEILSGKVADLNAPFLTRRLRELGVEVRRIETIPDEVEEIIRAVRSACECADYVLTTGGIGPTPDDLTVPAVAQALGRAIVRSPALERLLQDYYGLDELSVAQGRLAEIPEGAELIYSRGSPYPQLVVGKVYIFPGVPEFLQRKFEDVAELFKSDPILSRSLVTKLLETDLAGLLEELMAAFPDVKVGSYPQNILSDPQVELVLESRSAPTLEAAFLRLSEGLAALISARP